MYNSGMIRKIVLAKDPVLHKKSKSVKKIDQKIRNLAKDLKDTLISQKDPEGVGLAAPQIGKNIRMFAMKPKDKVRIIINPKILKIENIKTKKRNDKVMEGCLSIPNFYSPMVRPQKVKLRFQNLDGETIEEEFTGFSARIVQHEVDHLNGILFIDHLLKTGEPLYELKNDEWEEVRLSY